MQMDVEIGLPPVIEPENNLAGRQDPSFDLWAHPDGTHKRQEMMEEMIRVNERVIDMTKGPSCVRLRLRDKRRKRMVITKPPTMFRAK